MSGEKQSVAASLLRQLRERRQGNYQDCVPGSLCTGVCGNNSVWFDIVAKRVLVLGLDKKESSHGFNPGPDKSLRSIV